MSRMPAKTSMNTLAPRIASPVTRPRYLVMRVPSMFDVVVTSMSSCLLTVGYDSRSDRQLQRRLPQLDKVPLVAVQVEKDRDGAGRSLGGPANEGDAFRGVGVIIAPEVVGVKEQENAAAGLVADAGFLLDRRGSREQHVRAAGARR